MTGTWIHLAIHNEHDLCGPLHLATTPPQAAGIERRAGSRGLLFALLTSSSALIVNVCSGGGFTSLGW